jgi:hypothetical protein
MPPTPSRNDATDRVPRAAALGRQWLSRCATQRLLALCVFVAATWLVVLPWLGQQPSVRTHIDRNESLGIDPTAKFYTETESTRHALTRVDSLKRRTPRALWRRQ